MDPIQILATVAILGTIVAKAVEALRRKYTQLHGLAVMFVALAAGIGVAWAIDLRATVALLESIGATAGRTPPVGVDYVITGAAIAAGSGFIADVVNRTGTGAPGAEPEPERVLITDPDDI